MEQIDIVDINGELTGSCVDRAIVHALGLWHRTVHVWMHNVSGDLLLQKRSDTKDTHPGLWDISSAGHLSAGDNCIQGAVREVQEELGLSIYPEKLLPLFILKQHWESPDKTIIENEIKHVYLYDLPVDMNEIKVDAAEVSGVRFLTVEELKVDLVKNPHEYVPHEEEYARLFAHLAGEQGKLVKYLKRGKIGT